MRKNIDAVDLAATVALAVELATALGEPPVFAGALALAAHGYRRETHDADIIVQAALVEMARLEDAAKDLGLQVRARHSFGGVDLRRGDLRVDVLTLDRAIPELVPDAVQEALAADRRVVLFGHEVFFVSIGHLIAMKLVGERKKDTADIVELIKARIELGTWDAEHPTVNAIVRRHLGWYAVRVVNEAVVTARVELGRG